MWRALGVVQWDLVRDQTLALELRAGRAFCPLGCQPRLWVQPQLDMWLEEGEA